MYHKYNQEHMKFDNLDRSSSEWIRVEDLKGQAWFALDPIVHTYMYYQCRNKKGHWGK